MSVRRLFERQSKPRSDILHETLQKTKDKSWNCSIGDIYVKALLEIGLNEQQRAATNVLFKIFRSQKRKILKKSIAVRFPGLLLLTRRRREIFLNSRSVRCVKRSGLTSCVTDSDHVEMQSVRS